MWFLYHFSTTARLKSHSRLNEDFVRAEGEEVRNVDYEDMWDR